MYLSLIVVSVVIYSYEIQWCDLQCLNSHLREFDPYHWCLFLLCVIINRGTGESVGCVSYPLSAPYLWNRDKHSLSFLHRYSTCFHWFTVFSACICNSNVQKNIFYNVLIRAFKVIWMSKCVCLCFYVAHFWSLECKWQARGVGILHSLNDTALFSPYKAALH